MFGDNPIRKAEHEKDGLTLAVQEIFYTIQGEGPQAGRPCVFIRLAGCNLACTFCDTEFESGINDMLDLDQIVNKVNALPHSYLVVLTGGEPLRQNIVPLIERLTRRKGVLVQIETAGTLWLHDLSTYVDIGRVQIVCSPKTAKLHQGIVEWTRHYKYVLEAGRLSGDGLPAWGTQRTTQANQVKVWRKPAHNPATIWVSPCDVYDPVANKANVDATVSSALQHGYRLSMQVHKIINLP